MEALERDLLISLDALIIEDKEEITRDEVTRKCTQRLSRWYNVNVVPGPDMVHQEVEKTNIWRIKRYSFDAFDPFIARYVQDIETGDDCCHITALELIKIINVTFQ